MHNTPPLTFLAAEAFMLETKAEMKHTHLELNREPISTSDTGNII